MKRTRIDFEPAFLDVHGVAKRYDVKAATIWSWMNQRRFPQPLRLTPGCSRWSVDDLKIWEDQKRSECAPRHQWEEAQRKQQRGRDKAVQ